MSEPKEPIECSVTSTGRIELVHSFTVKTYRERNDYPTLEQTFEDEADARDVFTEILDRPENKRLR